LWKAESSVFEKLVFGLLSVVVYAGKYSTFAVPKKMGVNNALRTKLNQIECQQYSNWFVKAG